MLVTLLALAPLAAADDCDLKALRKDLDAASPVALPALYERIVVCDKAQAVRLTPQVFQRVLAGDEGFAAALKAIEIGAGNDVRTWLGSLEPDQRSRGVAWLGARCAESEPVQQFFLAAHRDKGLDFFTERWHRGLTDCRIDGVRELLRQGIASKELARNRPQLFNVLEVYARNLRGESIPGLVELAGNTSDPEELTYLVNAFADAAGVGSVAGVDGETARQAAAAIVELGPKLPERAVEQARTTLTALDADREADMFATHRWRDRKDPEGNYRYAVSVVETVTCKNGKTQGNFHIGLFGDRGTLWPEQILEELKERLPSDWALTTAERCKGTAELTYDMPKEPFATDEDRQRWVDDQVRAFTGSASKYGKAKVLRRDPFTL